MLYNGDSLPTAVLMNDLFSLCNTFVYCDTRVERAICVVYKNKKYCFKVYGKGLFAYNINDHVEVFDPNHDSEFMSCSNFNFLNTVEQIERYFSHRAIKGSRKATNLQCFIC